MSGEKCAGVPVQRGGDVEVLTVLDQTQQRKNRSKLSYPPARALKQVSESRTPATFAVLIGTHGSGKSTLLEAIAEAYGIDVRGGHGGRRYGSNLDKSPLGAAL